MNFNVTNDFEQLNKLYINQNGTGFIENSQDYKVASIKDDMGLAIGDYNNDHHIDIFITAINENILFYNIGDNTFQNRASEYGIASTGWDWCTKFADFDLDGDEDLEIANGFDFASLNEEENVYYRNDNNITNQVNLLELQLV